MAYDPYKAMYIHIPFCKQRCAYCDFATSAEKSDSKKVRKYVDKLILDIREASKQGKLSEIETVYIGGGTPTHLGHDKLVELVYFLSTTLLMQNVREFTVEANPESLNDEIVKDIYALGVNRLSLGVQSFQDQMLENLGRIHDSETAKNAIQSALTRFENASIDLMCGLPGQTTEMWEADLKTAGEIGVKHISIYPLTIEKGTKFYKLCMQGKMQWPDDDLQADMMQEASDTLKEYGFERYEVASYAKPGFESKHNSAYWQGVPYIGFGKSAATMTQNEERRMRVQDGRVTDDLNRSEMEAEDVMLGFRMSKGVSFKRLKQASEFLPELNNKLCELEAKGLIEKTDDSYVPTNKGWLCGNELYGEIFDLA
jgi:oxygen-independent coproporphyrinogen III oxidase